MVAIMVPIIAVLTGSVASDFCSASAYPTRPLAVIRIEPVVMTSPWHSASKVTFLIVLLIPPPAPPVMPGPIAR